MRTTLTLAALVLAACGLPPIDVTAEPGGGAELQDCGSWRQPVLCGSELQVYGQDRRWARLDPDRRLEMAPRTGFDLEISGRDQTGRAFPQSRLALAFDDRDCRAYLQVEDLGEGRLRIAAGSANGSCRLDIWVPGNLNHAWRLDIEVTTSARSGYSPAEATMIVNSLYRGLLNRDLYGPIRCHERRASPG